MAQDYYCYVIEIDGVPFYIGQGHTTRIYFHEWCARNNVTCPHYACAAIREANALKHEINVRKLEENLTREEAIQAEKDMISYGREHGWPLVNRSNGGLGPSGVKWTEQSKEYRSKAIKERWSDPVLIEEQRQKQLKRWSDPEEKAKQKQRMSDPELVKRNREAHIGKTTRAITYAGFVGPDGTVYKDVHNLASFCREHNLQKSNMCLVAKGTQDNHKGWRLLNE